MIILFKSALKLQRLLRMIHPMKDQCESPPLNTPEELDCFKTDAIENHAKHYWCKEQLNWHCSLLLLSVFRPGGSARSFWIVRGSHASSVNRWEPTHSRTSEATCKRSLINPDWSCRNPPSELGEGGLKAWLGTNTDARGDQIHQRGSSARTMMPLVCCAHCGHMHSSLRIDCPECTRDRGRQSSIQASAQRNPCSTSLRSERNQTRLGNHNHI